MKHLAFALAFVLGACDGFPSPTGDEINPVVEAGQDEGSTTTPANDTVDGVVAIDDKPVAEPEAPAIDNDPTPTEPTVVGNPCEGLIEDGLKPGVWDSDGADPGAQDPFDGLGVLNVDLKNGEEFCLVTLHGNGALWGGDDIEASSLPIVTTFGVFTNEADVIDGFLVQRYYHNGELHSEEWYKKR